MNIAVLVKPIPPPERRAVLEGPGFWLSRAGELAMDDSDSYGVEVALQLRDGAGEGTVSVVSMAPAEADAGLRSALAMGADGALLVSDALLVGADALTTAKVLAAAISTLSPDLVVAATESTDGSTGVVPVQVAELLGWSSVSYVTHVELESGALRARRQTEHGHEEVRCPLPAVLSVTAGAVEPRYPSLRGIMAARAKPVDVVGLESLGIGSEQVAPRQVVAAVTAQHRRTEGEIVEDDGAGHERVIAFLEQLRIL